MLGVGPHRGPPCLGATHLAVKQVGQDQVCPRERAWHAERHSRRALEGLLGAPARFVKVPKFAEGDSRIIEQDTWVAAELSRDLEQLIPDPKGLLVLPDRSQRDRLPTASTEEQLRASD